MGLTIYSNVNLDPKLLTSLKEQLRALGHELVTSADPTASNLHVGGSDPAIANADVAWGQPAVEDILKCQRLRFVQLTTAGYDRYDREDVRAAMHSRGGALCNASSVYVEPCAEHVLCQMMAAARRFPQAMVNQFGCSSAGDLATDASPWSSASTHGLASVATSPARGWPQVELRAASRLLVGQTVLICGLGAIGKRLVELLAPFRMTILATRRTPRGDEPCRIHCDDNLDALLPEADHVVNLLPGGAATKELFNAKRFSLMKQGAIFYNIGRGSTVNQAALIEALKSQHIAAAYLDVMTPEPLPSEDELWRMPNVFITPHTAGGFDREFETHMELLVANLQRFISGNALVDWVI